MSLKDVYEQKYADGDFDYNPDREQAWLKENLFERFGLNPGDKILDLGCGKGLHASLLANMGLDVFGVDITASGIRGATERGSAAVFVNASADDLSKYFDRNYFDLIYCRGMSWFHRELDQVCPSTGVNVADKIPYFMEFIRPGGLFVLQICSDFSGSRPEGSVHNNRLSDYRRLFEPHGEIVHVSNWAGVELTSDEQAAQVKGGVVIATQRPHRE